MPCETCGKSLDRNDHIPIYPECYALISSTADFPEIDDSKTSRTPSFWALGLLFFVVRLCALIDNSVVLYCLITAILLAALAIIFNIKAAKAISCAETKEFKVAKTGLVLGVTAILYSVMDIIIFYKQTLQIMKTSLTIFKPETTTYHRPFGRLS